MRAGGRGSAPHAPPPGAVRAFIGPCASRRHRWYRPRSSTRPLWPLIPGAHERARDPQASSHPLPRGLEHLGLQMLCLRPDSCFLLLAVIGERLSLGRGQLAPKPSVCSPGELHALDSAWYTFPLFQSRGGTLGAPGRASRANSISLGTERGGTETRKSCPNWSVRKVLGRGGEGVDGGPAPPAVAIVTESALL